MNLRLGVSTTLVLAALPAMAADCCGLHRHQAYTVVAPWIPVMQAPIVQAPPAVTVSQPQSALDVATLVRILTQVNGGGNGGGGGAGPTSDDARRMNDKLTNIETKLGRVEDLIQNRLTRVEDDLATLQKAQVESARQLEDRLNKTTEAVKVNTDHIHDSALAIQRTQTAIQRTQTATAVFYVSRRDTAKFEDVTLKNSLKVVGVDGEEHSLKGQDKIKTFEYKTPDNRTIYIISWEGENGAMWGWSQDNPKN